MTRWTRTLIAAPAVALSIAASPTFAQAPPAPASGRPNLKLTVVIARYTGEKAEKKTANLPFTLNMSAGDSTSLTMRSEIPVPTTTYLKDTGRPETSVQYRPVGTTIEVRSEVHADGRYRFNLSISDSQIFGDVNAPSASPRNGTIQSFTAQNWLMLRDGETIQDVTATDKTTGEVVKIDVTLNVLK